ncbi:ANTAR domain-containing protein [Streptomyces sp. NPDC102406]|uniref:ANTAR domain-containing protein n=1 Tax=Streptomyces sp. NPDC102406 TaxID=3366171 RepID=UPI003810FA96
MAESAQSGTGPSTTACAEPAVGDRRPGLTLFHHWDGERLVISVRGDLDLREDQRLDSALRPLLLASDGSVDLRLHDVDHCDCSAVNLLLDVDPAATSPPADPPEGAETELSREVVQLRRAMRSRGTIDMARGILVAAFGLSPQDAWSALVDVSQRTNIKLHLVARHLIDSTTGTTPLPRSVQNQLSAVIARRGDGADPDPAPTAAPVEPAEADGRPDLATGAGPGPARASASG